MSLYTAAALNNVTLGFAVDNEKDAGASLRKLEFLVRDGFLNDLQIDQILYGYADGTGLYPGFYNTDPANVGFMVQYAEARPTFTSAVYTGGAGTQTNYYGLMWSYPLVPPTGNAGAGNVVLNGWNVGGGFLNFLMGKRPGGRLDARASLLGNVADAERLGFAGLPSFTQNATSFTTVGASNAANNDTFTTTINGTPVVYTALTGSLTQANTQAGIASAINANATTGAIVYASVGASGKVNITARVQGSAGYFTLTAATTSGTQTYTAGAASLSLATAPQSVASCSQLGGGNYVTITPGAYSGIGTGVMVDVFATDANGVPLYYVGRTAPGVAIADYGNVGFGASAAGNHAGGNRLLPPCEVCVGPTSGLLFYGSTVTTREAGF